MKKVIIFLLIILFILSLVASGAGFYYHYITRYVTFKDDNGSVLQEIKLKKGEKVTMPETPTKHNCEFIEWRKDGKTYNFDSIVNENVTLVAEWKYFYDVKFLDEDESELSPSQTIEKGNKVIKPENPYKKASDFLGWTKENNTFDFDTPITENTSLIASWQKYEKYDLPVYGFHCAILEPNSYGGHSYKDIKKVYKGLEFICYIGAEIRGDVHYFKTISYQLDYGNGLKLVKAQDSAKVEGNVRKIIVNNPSPVYDGIQYTFKVKDISNKDELFVGIKHFKFTGTDDKFYCAEDRIINDLTKD